MNKTRAKEYVFTSISRCIGFRENHPIFFGICKIFFVGAPAFVLSYATLKLSKDLPFQIPLRAFLETHPAAVFTCLGWTVISGIIVQTTSTLLTSFQDRNHLKAYELMALLSALDRVVGFKLERFGKYSKGVTASVAGNTAFREITKPEDQIDYLIRNLFMLLATLTKDETLKIVLARMENDLPVEWVSFMPDDVHPDDGVLQCKQRKSLFSHCAKKKHPVVIPDIEHHLEHLPKDQQHYLASDLPGENEGSIVCFPILHDHSGNVIYALSVKSQKRKVIGESFKRKYGFMVKEFITRIKLEYSLSIIKSRAGQ
jgi:hypothetical protein